MIILDTNIILRYLLNDDARMADQAEQYLTNGNAFITVEVVAEVVYVLKGVYALERSQIAETLKEFLKLVRCRDSEVVNLALDTYAERNLDFVDCVLFGYHAIQGADIDTFDKKLLKLMANA